MKLMNNQININSHNSSNHNNNNNNSNNLKLVLKHCPIIQNKYQDKLFLIAINMQSDFAKIKKLKKLIN